MRKLRPVHWAVACSLVAGVSAVALAPVASADASGTFIILYKGISVPSTASATITAAGGTLVYSYPQIGVAIASSSSSSFGTTLRSLDRNVQGAVATAKFGTRLANPDTSGASADSPVTVTDTPAGGDSLSGLQWDMNQIQAPEAHEITGGDPSVVVGDIDTGLDFTHPDLAPNYDAANSVDCTSGAPVQTPVTGLPVGNDASGHGTHTAGTIAAAANGLGIVGVAPNVKIAGIKASGIAIAPNGEEFTGFFFPEAVVCSFMWAATHHIDVTNNSYFADPWEFNCKNDPDQRAIWIAERRAIEYAEHLGTVVVAAAGNDNLDISKTLVDTASPDWPPDTAVERTVTSACSIVPVEVPGVVGVSGDGNLRQKAYYSNYGVGVIGVVAPGGDRRFQLTAAAPNGRVLSTMDPNSELGQAVAAAGLSVLDCSVTPCAFYGYLQGTSMASPHVAGVAALIRSQHPGLMPGVVSAMLEATANPMACPPNPFNPGPPFAFQATCTGGPGYNSFFGHGEVDALTAVGG